MNYWVGVIVGCLVGLLFGLVTQFIVIQQNNELKAQIELLSTKVEKHDEIMRTYEFFNKTWERLYNENKEIEK